MSKPEKDKTTKKLREQIFEKAKKTLDMNGDITDNIFVGTLQEKLKKGNGNQIMEVLATIPIDKEEDKNNELFQTKLCGDKIDGGKCIEMLTQCLFKNSNECIKQWNSTDWSKLIDIETMDYGAAYNLASHLGFLDRTVDDVLKETGLSNLNDSTKLALEAIKRKVSPNSEKSKPIKLTKLPLFAISERQGTIPFDSTNQAGGGNNNNNYANFIRKMNNLKNNLSMNGGGYQESASTFRSSLVELEALLKSKGKGIDPKDRNVIFNLINSLDRTQARVRTSGKYINYLIKAIKEGDADVKAAIDKQDNVTYNILSELYKKHLQSKESGIKKIATLKDVLETIAKTAVDLEAIATTQKTIMEKINSFNTGTTGDKATTDIDELMKSLEEVQEKLNTLMSDTATRGNFNARETRETIETHAKNMISIINELDDKKHVLNKEQQEKLQSSMRNFETWKQIIRDQAEDNMYERRVEDAVKENLIMRGLERGIPSNETSGNVRSPSPSPMLIGSPRPRPLTALKGTDMASSGSFGVLSGTQPQSRTPSPPPTIVRDIGTPSGRLPFTAPLRSAFPRASEFSPTSSEQ